MRIQRSVSITGSCRKSEPLWRAAYSAYASTICSTTAA